MLHNMKLKPAPFEMIKSGRKTIALRLYDEKRQLIKASDEIVFTNTITGETLQTKVLKLHRFDSFAELYKSLPLLQCGYTSENVGSATPADMEQYYSVDEQELYGVVGIELILIMSDAMRDVSLSENVLDLKSVYEQLKDKYDLIFTNTYSLKNGAEDYGEDFMILRGKSSIGEFELSDCGLYIIFDVNKSDGGYVHWHPENYDEAVKDIELFMQGICKEQ